MRRLSFDVKFTVISDVFLHADADRRLFVSTWHSTAPGAPSGTALGTCLVLFLATISE